MQAFGAPGNGQDQRRMVSADASAERFAGIFGFMINLGTVRDFQTRPGIARRVCFPRAAGRFRRCIGVGFFGFPPGSRSSSAIGMAFFVKDTPEEAGFPPVESAGGNGAAMCAQAARHCLQDHRHQSGDLDRRLRLRLHRRGAARDRSMVSALSCRKSITSISNPAQFQTRRLSDSVRGVGRLAHFRIVSDKFFKAAARRSRRRSISSKRSIILLRRAVSHRRMPRSFFWS